MAEPPPGMLDAMTRSITHRGPDSDGFHVAGALGIGVRRLRVIDLQTGDQPIVSACSGSTIVYNGELYNYQELRAELLARGHTFRTRSDTEVVLHFYEEFGIAGMARLNGIFAFAIDDVRSNALVLVRDQLGVKPLYYARPSAESIVFASEQKALLASRLLNRGIDVLGLGRYLTYGHSVGEQSIFADIRRLPPGCALTFRGRDAALTRYWSLAANATRWEPGAACPTEQVEALLLDAVRRNTMADVPIGTFLSGGLDSSFVTACVSQNTKHLRTYSVGFGRDDDESADALLVSEALGTNHVAVRVTPDIASSAFSTVAGAFDEPFADAAAVPTYLIAKRARQDVTVVLTGEGGDELFGGYRRYMGEGAYQWLRRVPAPVRRTMAQLVSGRFQSASAAARAMTALSEDRRFVRYSMWTQTFDMHEVGALTGVAPDDLYQTYAPVAAEVRTVTDDIVAMMAVEIQTWLTETYLEKVDKSTMATSLEARVPLLDLRLVELLALAPRHWKINRGQTKIALRAIAQRYLPPATLRKPKQGFGPPVATWLRSSFRDRVMELTSVHAAIAKIVDGTAVRRVVRAFDRGEPVSAKVWSLLVLDEWMREHSSTQLQID